MIVLLPLSNEYCSHVAHLMFRRQREIYECLTCVVCPSLKQPNASASHEDGLTLKWSRFVLASIFQRFIPYRFNSLTEHDIFHVLTIWYIISRTMINVEVGGKSARVQHLPAASTLCLEILGERRILLTKVLVASNIEMYIRFFSCLMKAVLSGYLGRAWYDTSTRQLDWQMIDHPRGQFKSKGAVGKLELIVQDITWAVETDFKHRVQEMSSWIR